MVGWRYWTARVLQHKLSLLSSVVTAAPNTTLFGCWEARTVLPNERGHSFFADLMHLLELIHKEHWLDDGLYAHWLYLQTTRFMEPKLAIKSLCIAYGYERWREEFADKSSLQRSYALLNNNNMHCEVLDEMNPYFRMIRAALWCNVLPELADFNRRKERPHVCWEDRLCIVCSANVPDTPMHAIMECSSVASEREYVKQRIINENLDVVGWLPQVNDESEWAKLRWFNLILHGEIDWPGPRVTRIVNWRGFRRRAAVCGNKLLKQLVRVRGDRNFVPRRR
jgi:hypothetical protein